MYYYYFFTEEDWHRLFVEASLATKEDLTVQAKVTQEAKASISSFEMLSWASKMVDDGIEEANKIYCGIGTGTKVHEQQSKNIKKLVHKLSLLGKVEFTSPYNTTWKRKGSK